MTEKYEKHDQKRTCDIEQLEHELRLAKFNMEHIVIDYRGWGVYANKDRLAVMERVLTHIRKALACIQEYEWRVISQNRYANSQK